MKRLFFVVFLVLVLCGCSKQNGPSINSNKKSDETIPCETIHNENNTPAETTLPTEESVVPEETTEEPELSEYDRWLEEIKNPLDGEGMIPLLFIETEMYEDRAYVLGAGKDGAFYLADRFEYDGQPLYSENIFDGRMMQESEPATSPILEEQHNLQFQNSGGVCFMTNHEGLTTDGEGTSTIRKIYTFAELPENAVPTSGLYLGSYSDAPMFPQDAEYTDQGVIVDLDGNGVKDRVTWELFEERPFEFLPINYSDYLYNYKVTIEQNGIVCTIKNDDYKAVLKHGMAVFVADADQNGDFEVIIYERDGLNARIVMVYDFDGTTFIKREVCPVVIMN